MLDGWDSSLEMLDTPESRASAYLQVYPALERALREAERNLSPRTSGTALQVRSGKPRKWAPGDASEPELFVLTNDRELTLARQIVQTLSEIPLTYLEAQVLHRHLWKGLSLHHLADLLGTAPGELTAAHRSLLAKVAEHMGPAERAIASSWQVGRYHMT